MVTGVQTGSLLQEDSRRFKIKLAASDSTSSVEMCHQCLTVLSNFITFREMGSQTNVHDNSFMESQSLLDYNSQPQHPPQSPVRSVSSATDAVPQPVPSVVTAQRVETSSLAKVQSSAISVYCMHHSSSNYSIKTNSKYAVNYFFSCVYQ